MKETKMSLPPMSPEMQEKMVLVMKPFIYAMFPYMKTLDDLRSLAEEAQSRNVKVAPERILEILDG